MTISDNSGTLTLAHVGDLHVTAEHEPNYRDFQSIVESMNTNLDAFYQRLQVRALPNATTVAGYRCLFLDVVSAGGGGHLLGTRLGPSRNGRQW